MAKDYGAERDAFYSSFNLALDKVLASYPPPNYTGALAALKRLESDSLANSLVDSDLALNIKRRTAESCYTAAMLHDPSYQEIQQAYHKLCELGFADTYWKRYYSIYFATYLYSIGQLEQCVILLKPCLTETQEEVDIGNNSVLEQLNEITQLLYLAQTDLSQQESSDPVTWSQRLRIVAEQVARHRRQVRGAIERFQRLNPATHDSVEIQLLDPVSVGDDPWNNYREVRLLLHDGRLYEATFWCDPMRRSGCWWEEPGMVIVQDLTVTEILAAVDQILQQDAIENAFESLNLT